MIKRGICSFLFLAFTTTMHAQTDATMDLLILVLTAQESSEKGDFKKAKALYSEGIKICSESTDPQVRTKEKGLHELMLVVEAKEFIVSLRDKSKSILDARRAGKNNKSDLDFNKLENNFIRYQSVFERAEVPLVLADMHRQMGNLYFTIDRYTDARRHFQQCLLIQQKQLGKTNKLTLETQAIVGGTYQLDGMIPEGIKIVEQTLELVKEPQDSIKLTAALAAMYNDLNEPIKTMQLYEKALKLEEKYNGKKSGNYALLLSEVAYCWCFYADDEVKAETALREALEIHKKYQKPPVDPVTILANLSLVLDVLGKTAESKEISQKLLEIAVKNKGPNSLAFAGALNGLAAHDEMEGNLIAAYDKYTKALAICMDQQADNNPLTTTLMRNISRVNYRLHQNKLAGEMLERLARALTKQLSAVLRMDEKSRLSWITVNADVTFEPMILSPRQLADIIFTRKGVVLDSLCSDRAMARRQGNNNKAKILLDELSSIKSRLSKISFAESIDEQAGSDALVQKADKIERQLAEMVHLSNKIGPENTITSDNILHILQRGDVLLEFLSFEDPNVTGDEVSCYGAILIYPQSGGSSQNEIAEQSKNIKFIRIGNASAINRAIESLKTGLTQGGGATFEENMMFLSAALWKPIASELPDSAKRLLIGPDGLLNFVSFATLQESDGRFVAEKYAVSYVGTGRDLVRNTIAEKHKSISIFADPIFDYTTSDNKLRETALRSAEPDLFAAIKLPPLPGTRAECEYIKLLADAAGWDSEIHLGQDATEMQVRALHKPGVFHLATHGFYLNSFEPSETGTRGMKAVALMKGQNGANAKRLIDPMRASGVALTGAQTTLSSWSNKRAPNPENDGVLTAEEVAALDLNGTWLVTLSACETGSGVAKSGEGVFGLRRAFMIAGAENLLLTLWPVNDEITAKMMSDFYKEAFATGDASGSLAKVQRDWLVKLRREKGLLAAVRDAGPFIMTTMGALPAHATFSAPQKSNFLR